jgi:GTP pyrophosphokinase
VVRSFNPKLRAEAMIDAVSSPQVNAPGDGDAVIATWLAEVRARLSEGDAEVIAQAIALAAPACASRTLATGESALARALAVAGTLLQLRLDPETLAAALVFRALEVVPDLAARCRERLGDTVASLAEGVIRMAQVGALSGRPQSGQRPAEQAAQLEALRKMLLAMVQDVRVVIVKLVDQAHELRAAVKLRDESVRRPLAELARDIFAPLANRLGVWQLKWELEDLSLRILEPEAYARVARLLDERRADRQRYIETVIGLLRKELAHAGIEAEVTGRPKHIFSIYKKMKRKAVDFESLYDVRAVRILVDGVKDCYAALGLVHHLWSPIPKEFDDYIARPKSNGYRSLHTAVVGPEAKAIEVQIRTHEMHQHSELGVAAHWRYKEGSRPEGSYDQKIAWLRQILEWKDDVRDASELAEQFRTGLVEDTVYVLTPQGRVIDLPSGATPIDFAYHVHSELGHRCRGAKVDGLMVPLNTPLSNGQRVEILAAKQGGPSRDWLNPQLGFLKSQSARTKVRQWYNRQNYEADVAQGRVLLEKELQRHGRSPVPLDGLAAAFGYAKAGDFLADLGRGEIGPKQLHDALTKETAETAPGAEQGMPTREPRARATSAVLVVGVDKLLTLTARCCKPAPPEPITGFITRGRGVSVHRANCANLSRLDPARRVPAEWGAAEGAVFPVDIEVSAIDRTGLLRDISEVLSRERINVTATHSASSDLAARMRFTLEVRDLEQLQRALAMLREVRGVTRALRRR